MYVAFDVQQEAIQVPVPLSQCWKLIEDTNLSQFSKMNAIVFGVVIYTITHSSEMTPCPWN